MNPTRRLIAFMLLGLLCLCNPAPANESGGGEVGETKLPGSTKGLGDYLVNTVWDLEGGGIFRFRGDGTMVMPWHDFQWKPTGKRTVQMFTNDWRWEVSFSEDMSSLEVPDRYKGKLVRRLSPPLDDEKLEEILLKSTWSRVSKSGEESLTFAKHGKVVDSAKVWKSWELFQGLLIVKGVREGKNLRDEYLLKKDEQPYVFAAPEEGDRPRLEQR